MLLGILADSLKSAFPLLGDLPCPVLAAFDLLGAALAKLAGEVLLGRLSEAGFHILAVNEEVFSVYVTPTKNHMHMRVAVAVVLDCEPFELGPQVAFRLRHDFACHVLQ